MEENIKFEKSIHKFGRWSSLFIFVLLMLVPIIISLMCGYFPSVQDIITPVITLMIIILSVMCAELIAYPPIFGAGALYMCYVTGNVSSLKIPCVIAALNASDVEMGTDKGNAVAMVAVGFSSLVTIIIILLSLLFMAPLEPILQSDALQPVFNNVVPALFGALIGMQALVYFKQTILAVVICSIGTFILGISQTYIMLICIIIMLIINRIIYVKKLKSKV